jgi:tetratricopeptide (TPR) repeat protein
VLELWPGGDVTTDVERFESASAAALHSGDPPELARASALYAGELLPDDRSESWSEARRRALRDRYLEVLRRGGMWQRLVDVEPTEEEAHRELMRAHLEAGNRREAIRQFERLREVLREELGVGPDPLSVAVYERVLALEGQDAPTAAERARALLAWGVIHWKRKDLEEAERTALEARALAVDAGLGAQVGEASMLLASIGIARGNWRNFLRDELVETVRRTPDLAPFVFDSNLCFTEFCLYLPDGTREMAAFALELGEAAAVAGSTRAAALAALVKGETELLEGRVSEAEETLKHAAELHRASDTDSGEAVSLERLAEASTVRGQRWKARRLLQSAMRRIEDDPLGSHVFVKILGAKVDAAANPAEAADLARKGEATLSDRDVCEQCSMSFRMAATRAFTRAGDLRSARRHLDEAARVSEMWQGGPWPAAVQEARSDLERAEQSALQLDVAGSRTAATSA